MKKTTPQLEDRARDVLFAVVTEYVETGRPVGSGRLAQRYGIPASTATIRAEMNRLEKLGLLVKPHTSAGRIPSDAGFRVFVTDCMTLREPPDAARTSFLSKVRETRPRGGALWRAAGRLLAEATRQAAIVVVPSLNRMTLRQIRFVRTGHRDLLAVVVASNGLVHTTVLRPEIEVVDSEIERIHNYLAGIAEGRTLMEIIQVLRREREAAREDLDLLRTKALDLGTSVLMSAIDDAPDLLIEGEVELMSKPEFAKSEKMHQVISTLKEKDILLALLELTVQARGGVQIVIGGDAPLGLEGVSLVTAPFSTASETGGALGVLGPSRMDYPAVVPLVALAADALSRAFDED